MKAVILVTDKKDKQVYKSVDKVCQKYDLSADTVQNYLTRQKKPYIKGSLKVERILVKKVKAYKLIKLQDGTCVQYDGDSFKVM